MRGEDGQWRDETVEGLDGMLPLPEMDVTLTMAEIYEDSDVARAAVG